MASPSMVHTTFFVIGAPGSGKGTLCRKLSDDYGPYHLSVGDFLREISQGTPSDERGIVLDYLQQGRLLPSHIMLPLLRKKIEEEKSKGHRNFLVDGFPRDLSQGLEFRDQVGSPALVISLRCPKETAKERYLSRRLPDRLNDDAEMFEKRFEEFNAKNPPIVNHYRTHCTLEEVDSSTETETTYGVLVATLSQNRAWEVALAQGEDASITSEQQRGQSYKPTK